MINNEQRSYKSNIFRLAANLYADTDKELSLKQDNILYKFIESSFILDNNTYHSVDSIKKSIQKHFYVNLTDNEILNFIKKKSNDLDLSKCNTSELLKKFPQKTNLEKNLFRLNDHRYVLLIERENKFNISDIIQSFIFDYRKKYPNVKKSALDIEDLIINFIFDKFISNFSNYRYIVESKERFDSKKILSNLKTENNKYTDSDEIDIINNFLDFEDNNKSKYIFYIINLAFDYSITITSNSNSKKTNHFLNRNLYLDANILYRALGLNNNDRKEKINLFLEKCIRNGQSLFITNITNAEFLSSIQYKCDSLNKYSENISYKCFSHLQNNYDFLSDFEYMYFEKKDAEKTLNPILFRAQCISDYRKLLDKYNIKIIEFKSEFSQEIGKNIDSLKNYKISKNANFTNFESVNNDIFNLNYLYNLIPKNNVNDNKNFFVTTDNILIAWTKEEYKNYTELCLSPSDWLSFILRFVDRTENEYSTFISFLRLNHPKQDFNTNHNNMIKVLNMIDSNFDNESDQVEFLEIFMRCCFDKLKNVQSEKEFTEIFESEALNYERDKHKLEQLSKDNTINNLENTLKNTTLQSEIKIKQRDKLLDYQSNQIKKIDNQSKKQDTFYKNELKKQEQSSNELFELLLTKKNLLFNIRKLIINLILFISLLSIIFIWVFKFNRAVDTWIGDSKTREIFVGTSAPILATILALFFKRGNFKNLYDNFKKFLNINKKINNLCNKKIFLNKL